LSFTAFDPKRKLAGTSFWATATGYVTEGGKAGIIEYAHYMLMSKLAGAALPSQKLGVNVAWLRVSFRLSAPQARRPTRGIAHFQTQRLRFLLLNTVARVIRHTHTKAL
jgi:hypothetical protein